MNSMSSNIHGFDLLLTRVPEPAQYIDIKLPEQGSWSAMPHRVGEAEALAIVAAVGAGRPLLLEGEPGIGKSHLARAAAELLDWHFISSVVQPDTEYRELLWQMDHTERLGHAQLLAHSPSDNPKEILDVEKFISAGPLWWAFDYAGKKPGRISGQKKADADCGDGTDNPRLNVGYQPEIPMRSTSDTNLTRDNNGIVLLIDEIDKADISLCNGLLEALGNNGFRVPVIGKTVRSTLGRPPLVIITSNQTRHLPPAFLRRCIRLTLQWPDQQLEAIGQLHYKQMDAQLIEDAASLIREDRQSNPEPPKSGLAEFLDLLRALSELPDDAASQWLERLGPRFLKGSQR